MFRHARIFAFALLLLSPVGSQADWRDDSGFTQLQAELGASLPTGAGIAVLQCEAQTTMPVAPYTLGAYLPQTGPSSPITGTGDFSGDTFFVEAPLSDTSGHAAVVGSTFYASASASSGVTQIYCYEAEGFLNLLYGTTPPPAFPGAVQNHSYVGATGNNAVDTELIRRYDQMVAAQNTVLCVPVDNGSGSTISALPSSTYHSISAGLRNGDHGRGGTLIDTSGRMKPDLVVNQSFTSFASPAIASCAVLLKQLLQSSAPTYNTPPVIKSLLLAGASKTALPQWQRLADTAPYDTVYGAGELNIYNSYHIFAAGHSSASPSLDLPATSWDAATSSSTTPILYFFTIPSGKFANNFSAAMTWHRSLAYDFMAGSYTSTVPQLTLALFASNAFAPEATPISQSISTVDNVQHLFLRNLPPGQYALQITATTNTPYALAWQSQLGAGPSTSTSFSGPQFNLQAANIDPYTTYTIEKSTDLVHWTIGGTVRTADTTPATTFMWQDATPGNPSGFYRLKWTSLRQ